MIAVTTRTEAGIAPRKLFSESCDQHDPNVMAFASSQEEPQTPSVAPSHGKECPDFLTMSTDDETMSSLSSVGEDDNDSLSELTVSPRSIFQCYWNKSVSSSRLLLHSSPSPGQKVGERIPLSVHGENPRDDDESDSPSCISYERSLRRNEGIPSAKTCPVDSPLERRSIFGNSQYISQSMSSLRAQLPVLDYRKTSSASDLEGNGPPSCLRSRQRRTRSSSAVSFSSHVTVMEFKNSQEAWAADGWSKYFH